MIRFFSIAFFVACTTTTAFGQTNTDTNKSSISMMAAYPLIDSNTLTVVNGKPDTSGTPDNNEEKVFERVEIEASFPGGDALWRRYLERNLDGSTPTKNGAPEGTYTVVVQFIVDKEGYIFDEAPYFSGEVYFKFYGVPEPNTENPAGSYVAKGYFDKLILFKNTLTEINLKPAVIYIQDGEDAKILLSKDKASSLAPEIIFKKDSDYQKIAENLKAALDTEPLISKFKNNYSTLQYIDLRFGNKVYFK